MPARSQTPFQCFCADCTLECGPGGKRIPAVYRVAHLASIQSRSVAESSSALTEQPLINSTAQDASISSIPIDQPILVSDAQNTEDTATDLDASGSESANSSDMKIGSDQEGSSERERRMLASMSKLTLYPRSSPAARAAVKREANRRTTKSHEILDHVERRVKESLVKLSHSEFGPEQVPAFCWKLDRYKNPSMALNAASNRSLTANCRSRSLSRIYKRDSRYIGAGMRNYHPCSPCITIPV